MTPHPIYLVDPATGQMAALDVKSGGDHYSGTIAFDGMPLPIKRLFQEFEELVEGQVFNLADEVEEKIASIPLQIIFDNGKKANVADLQIFPSTKRVSFKTRQQTVKVES